MRKTSTRGRPLPALPNSKPLPPSHQDVDTGQTGTQQRREPYARTDIGTYSQLPGTVGFVGNQKYGRGTLQQGKVQERTILYYEAREKYPGTYESHYYSNNVGHFTEEEDINDQRQASQQSGHGGQPTAEDTDKTGRNGARLLENPMYVPGVSRQDDGERTILSYEAREKYPGTYESHYYSDNVGHYTEEEDINDQRQASQQSGHGGQPTAEDTDKTGRNGARLLENPMYVPGVLRQDDGGPSASYFREEETEETSPGTKQLHVNDEYHCIDDDEITNPRQASQQSEHGGRSTAKDTDRTGHDCARLLENPMYATGVSRPDDGGPSASSFREEETKEESPTGGDVNHDILDDEITNPRQASQQSGHGGQPTAEDTDKTGRNGAGLLENPMYVSGVLRQDDGDDIDAADCCVFPRNFDVKSHRSFVILLVTIAIVVAAAIGAGVGHGLVKFLTTVQETHPPTLNSSLERSDTSSRPVSPFPATPTGSTLANKSGNLSLLTVATEDSANTTASLLSKTTDGVTMPETFSTDLETRVYPQTGTAKTVAPETTANVLTKYVERTEFDQLQKTTKQRPLTTHEGWLIRDSSWVVGSTSTPLVTYDAAKALDGDTGTYWNSHNTHRRYKSWYITFNLTVPQTLTGIAVNNYGDTVHDIAAFTLQKSQVGSPYNWENVVSVTNVQGGIAHRQEFGGFWGTAQYWNFLITRTHSGWQPWLRELNFLGSSAGANIALGKSAFQTTTFYDVNGVASHAVDGNTDTSYGSGSCTHTANTPGEDNPTWWVDLGQSYVIGRVAIFNRQDCCSERINPFNIHIGDSDQVSTNPRCGGDHQIDVSQPSISVSCQGVVGRYVSVRLPGSSRILTLCEVQLVSQPKAFRKAKLACKAEGATLAMPKTKELDLALRRLVKRSGSNSVYWIGLEEDGSGWKWVDGTRLGHYQVCVLCTRAIT
uniref:F5/8 type C domain-containing protein n=1 Tax=Branchiostoma floridae TaxID=7739 RepID=C3ZFD9_BRAFL|eukprot:XP_002592682.1 hypothetical protein BRAFLDRAFT_67120 [Branchiostoma floridae]